MKSLKSNDEFLVVDSSGVHRASKQVGKSVDGAWCKACIKTLAEGHHLGLMLLKLPTWDGVHRLKQAALLQKSPRIALTSNQESSYGERHGFDLNLLTFP